MMPAMASINNTRHGVDKSQIRLKTQCNLLQFLDDKFGIEKMPHFHAASDYTTSTFHRLIWGILSGSTNTAVEASFAKVGQVIASRKSGSLLTPEMAS